MEKLWNKSQHMQFLEKLFSEKFHALKYFLAFWLLDWLKLLLSKTYIFESGSFTYLK